MNVQSIKGKNWLLKKFNSSDVSFFSENFDLSEIVSKLLSIRKDKIKNIDQFLNPKIKMSKIFDNATSCSSENSIILVQKIYDEFINLMKLEGGVLLNNSEKKLLEKALWVNGKLNRNLIAKHASKIANEIKLNLNS